MPSMQEIGVKARKMRDALGKEEKRLRAADDSALADHLKEFAENAGSSSLARLFDLIREHDSKASALVALEGGRP